MSNKKKLKELRTNLSEKAKKVKKRKKLVKSKNLVPQGVG